MPELLTRRKTRQSIAGRVAGFKSEWWPDSFRNGGRHQIGTVAGFASEYPAGFNRNPHEHAQYVQSAGHQRNVHAIAREPPLFQVEAKATERNLRPIHECHVGTSVADKLSF
jgi:hypothetical protein